MLAGVKTAESRAEVEEDKQAGRIVDDVVFAGF
jgi:hypothetical protein